MELKEGNKGINRKESKKKDFIGKIWGCVKGRRKMEGS